MPSNGATPRINSISVTQLGGTFGFQDIVSIEIPIIVNKVYQSQKSASSNLRDSILLLGSLDVIEATYYDTLDQRRIKHGDVFTVESNGPSDLLNAPPGVFFFSLGPRISGTSNDVPLFLWAETCGSRKVFTI